jgi:hypothetical protein
LLGAFQITMVISTKELLLFREERLYAWLLFIQKAISLKNRWHPVFQRYIDQIRGRVLGFGGDPNKILPSPTGDVPHPKLDHGEDEEHKERRHFTGKVVGLVYDRFGDFDGFRLLTEHGREHSFRACEHEVEALVHRAWIERIVVTIFVEPCDPDWPVSIMLRRAPNPYER